MIDKQNSENLPLSGIKVVDYSHFLAGPHLSRSLAAMGADVIKVERPKEGDAGRAHGYIKNGVSGYFLQQNMGKRGLCINVKDKRGLEMLHRLIREADVFVENYRPGALDKLGLGYAELSKINPSLIYCSVSAYGHSGPDSNNPGFGLIAEAKSGAMAQIGDPGCAPPLLRMPLADLYSGTHGVAAVCAALVGRQKTGKGRHIDLALYDCMVSMHDFAVQVYSLSGEKEIPVQTGHNLPDSTVYGVFTAKDAYIVIAAQVDDAWKRLAQLVGGEKLAADPRFHGSANRKKNSEAALSYVQNWVSAQPSANACLQVLEGAGVPAALVQTIDQVIADPQIKARNMIIEQEHPVIGKIKLPNLPYRFSDCDTTPRRLAPTLGQHNREIAVELGYSGSDIDAMVKDGVLYAETSASQ